MGNDYLSPGGDRARYPVPAAKYPYAYGDTFRRAACSVSPRVGSG